MVVFPLLELYVTMQLWKKYDTKILEFRCSNRHTIIRLGRGLDDHILFYLSSLKENKLNCPWRNVKIILITISTADFIASECCSSIPSKK